MFKERVTRKKDNRGSVRGEGDKNKVYQGNVQGKGDKNENDRK